MAVASPIKPSDLGAITSGVLACDHLRELLNTRTKMQTFLAWLLQNDSTGLLGADFKAAIIQQLLFNSAQKGWFVRTHSESGYLDLVEKVALADLATTGAADGDRIIYDATAGMWVVDTAPEEIYLPPTSGGVTVPAATTGGVLTVAHGLGAKPNIFEVDLVCATADVGHAVGDVVDACSLMSRTTAPEAKLACTKWANDTQCGVTFFNGSAGASYRLFDKATFTNDPITEASWNVKFYAKL